MGNRRCICEICTCGRHKCPHRPNISLGTNKPCLMTEYATTYRKHPIDVRESCKPLQVPIQGDQPLEDRTTHRADYVPHPVARPMFKVPDPYVQPEGEIQSMTSYNTDYNKKQVSPAKAIRHDGTRSVPAKFEGIPTYQSDYRKWGIDRPTKFGDVAPWQPPVVPFEGCSTFTHDYTKYNQRPRSSMRPNQAANLSDTPFDGSTGYKDSYVKHPLQPKFSKDKDAYKPSGVKFDGLSTFMRDFKGTSGPKTDSCKPSAVAFMSDAPLEDATTNKSDYRKWRTERPFHHNPDPYQKPEGEMDMNTTHNLTFKQFPCQRQAAVRPQTAHISHAGPFDGTTNYNTNYRAWKTERLKMTMKPDYKPNLAPFEGMSTQKAHYIKHQLNPSQSCRPSANVIQSGSPLDDNTMYRTDYTPKQIVRCPALAIEQSQNFRFVELDTRGHRMFQPSYEIITPLPGNNLKPQVKIQTLVA